MRNVILVLVLEFFLCVSGIKLNAPLKMSTRALPTSPRRQRILKAEEKLPALKDNMEKAWQVYDHETDEMDELDKQIQFLSEQIKSKGVDAFLARNGLGLGSLFADVGSIACSVVGCKETARDLAGASEAMGNVEHGINLEMQERKKKLTEMKENRERLKRNVDEAIENLDEARRIYRRAKSDIDNLIKERDSARLLEKMLFFPNLKRILELNEEARKASHGPGSASDDLLSTRSEASDEDSESEPDTPPVSEYESEE